MIQIAARWWLMNKLINRAPARCAACNKRIRRSTAQHLGTYTLCEKHLSEARGEFEWAVCLLSKRILTDKERAVLIDAVVECLRREV